jgi:hypothetical protein
MTITTGMHPAMARAEADHMEWDDEMNDLEWLFSVRRKWEYGDPSVGEGAGWIYEATVIGAVWGDLVLSREHMGKAFGKLDLLEINASEHLTERADDDPPMMPSRMEDAE